MHRISASGLVLLVTLTSGTYAQKVDVIPETSCPDIQPADGTSCSPFLSFNETCTYRGVCCPGDGGACAPETTCYCDGSSSNWYCYNGGGDSIPCPSMCPKTPPAMFDTCDIDSRFSCVYGDAVFCDEMGWEYEHEKECFCTDGHFYCSSNTCPVACPATQPVEGEACTDFMGFYCSYDEFCCPGDDSDVCVPNTQCYCNTNMTITCYEPSIVCPSVCPVSNPIESDSSSLCAMDERYLCKYENGTCPSTYEVGETTCTCSSGNYECTQTCMIFDYEYADDAIYDGAPGESDPLENMQNPPGTVVEEDMEPRNTTLDSTKSHNPSNGKKKKKKTKKKKKHANKKSGQTKKDGKTRTLLRSQLGRPGGNFFPYPE